jgi:hypothetical protein
VHRCKGSVADALTIETIGVLYEIIALTLALRYALLNRRNDRYQNCVCHSGKNGFTLGRFHEFS